MTIYHARKKTLNTKRRNLFNAIKEFYSKSLRNA